MAITATYSVAEAKVDEDTQAIAFSGLANSTTYLFTLSLGAVQAPSLPVSGDTVANPTTWNALIASPNIIDSIVIKTGGAATTYTWNVVPTAPGTFTVGVYVISFSNTMTGTATFTAISSG